MTANPRDLQRWARRGTTTQRGLGPRHRTQRDRQLAALIDGTPCRRCGQPRYHPARCPLPPDGHPDHAPRIDGGDGQDSDLEHAYCNRAAGARLSAARRRRYRPPPAW